MCATMLGWHFTGERLRGGAEVPSPGIWLEHDGPVELCRSGYHAATDIAVALELGGGSWIHRVELQGDVIEKRGIAVARRRRILWSVRGARMLRVFAGEAASLACWVAGSTSPVTEQAAKATANYRLGRCELDDFRRSWSKVAEAHSQARWGASAAASTASALLASRSALTAVTTMAYSAAHSTMTAVARAASLDATPGTWATAGDAAWSRAWTSTYAVLNARLAQLVESSDNRE